MIQEFYIVSDLPLKQKLSLNFSIQLILLLILFLIEKFWGQQEQELEG